MALIDDVMKLTGGTVTEEKATIYLSQSESIIMNRLYPYGYDDGKEFPARYNALKVRIAVYLIDKEGAEGEKSHSEGGITRTYSDSDVPSSMLEEIVPKAKVMI